MEVAALELPNWNPDYSFLSQVKCPFFDPYGMRQETAEWQFENIKTGLPISFTICKMTALGISVSGYGDSVFLKSAMVQSFAEAWERLWMLYLKKNGPERFSNVSSSNGFAAGASLTDATNASKEELIDRAILMNAWEKQTGWKPHRLKGVRSRGLASLMLSRGWDLRFYKISDSSLGAILVGLGVHKTNGAIFDSCFLSPKKKETALEIKVVRSLLKSMSFHAVLGNDPNWRFPEEGDPMDHWIFYKNPDHQKAFHFLQQDVAAEGIIELSRPELITTEAVFQERGFPVVAVSRHPDWPSLRWGKNSISGINPWPHPLA